MGKVRSLSIFAWFTLGEIQLFLRFHGPPTQSVRDRVVSIGDGPWFSDKLSKVWRVYVWQNYNQKTSFHVQLLISLIIRL